MNEFFIVESDAGERIDRYLSEMPEGYSRSFLQKLIKENHIKVNDKPVKPSYRLGFRRQH